MKEITTTQLFTPIKTYKCDCGITWDPDEILVILASQYAEVRGYCFIHNAFSHENTKSNNTSKTAENKSYSMPFTIRELKLATDDAEN